VFLLLSILCVFIVYFLYDFHNNNNNNNNNNQTLVNAQYLHHCDHPSYIRRGKLCYTRPKSTVKHRLKQLIISLIFYLSIYLLLFFIYCTLHLFCTP